MSRGIKWPSSVRRSKEVPEPWRRNGLSKDLSEEHARCRLAGAGAVCRTRFSGGKREIGRGNANRLLTASNSRLLANRFDHRHFENLFRHALGSR
jgi:hypothetical protein